MGTMIRLLTSTFIIGIIFAGASSFAGENVQNRDVYQVRNMITDVKVDTLELIFAKIEPSKEFNAYNCTSGDGVCGTDCGPGECCTSGWDYCYCVPC